MRNEDNWFSYQRRLFPSSLPLPLRIHPMTLTGVHDGMIVLYPSSTWRSWKMPNSKAYSLVIELVLRHCSCFPKLCFSPGDQAIRRPGNQASVPAGPSFVVRISI
ncbi:hypothetical protein BJX62DRAFT_195506 [Aspergillus germanicus]